MHMRIDHAKRLLAATELNVKEISEKVGYLDTSGFIKRFRRYTGMTPVMYRQRAQKNT